MSQIGKILQRVPIPVPTRTVEAPIEPRISVLGVRRSGKSTFIGGWHIRLVDKALKGELKYRVHEYSTYGLEEKMGLSGQTTAAAEMRDGKFPLPTPQGLAFEADMSIRFPRRFGGERTVHMPLIDVAGEDVARSIENISNGQWTTKTNPIVNELYNKIFRATGIILVMSAASVTELEGQPENLFYIADVNLRHIVERVLDYKSKEASAIPIKAMAVILTKYDAVAERLLVQGMDLQTVKGRDKFMTKHFPETYSMLGWYGLNKCLFLPTWVDLQYDTELTKSIEEEGVLQPILVRPVKDRYEIIVGSRRFSASKAAGLKTIPAIVKEMSDGEAIATSLIENIQRGNLTDEEEIEAMSRLMKLDEERYGSQRKLAKGLGLSQATIERKFTAYGLVQKLRARGEKLTLKGSPTSEERSKGGTFTNTYTFSYPVTR